MEHIRRILKRILCSTVIILAHVGRKSWTKLHGKILHETSRINETTREFHTVSHQAEDTIVYKTVVQ